MDHRPQRMLARNRPQQRCKLIAIGCIAGRDPHLTPEQLEIRHQRVRALGLQAAAADQQQMPDTMSRR